MQKNKHIIPIAIIICAISVIIMVLVLTIGRKEKTPEFTPPPFDNTAVSGVPQVNDPSWMELYQDGMSFSAHLCGNVVVRDGKADVYLTNNAQNNTWLKLRVTDENGKLLGETGLIKPNEYVKSVSFSTVPSVGQKIKLKLMSYEPKTYYSMGSVVLNTVVSGG